MGCICSKGAAAAEEYIEAYVEAQQEKSSIKFSKQLVAQSRREEVVVPDARASSFRNDGARTRLISKSQENVAGTPRVALASEEERKVSVGVDPPGKVKAHQRWATVDLGSNEAKPKLRIAEVPNGLEGEHVAAGWPSWLAAAAGEAIKGWLPRKGDSFERLDKIGQGTYSNVYRARDLDTGKIVALKKVRFVNTDLESVRFMAREIHILRRLDHPNIVKLEGLVTSQTSCSLYLIFEYMEHDLAGLGAAPGFKFSEPQIKCYMQQLLRGLEHCHNQGVLHRDIKGSNLLIDNNGILKIADFGLATFFNPDKRQPLTSRVVTLWYRPPELLLGATEYGVAVDLWSTGCILAELLSGKPIMTGRTEVEQLHKIFKLCGSPSEEYWRKSKLPHATVFKPQHPYRRCVSEMFKDFPPSAMSLLDILLAIEPEGRGTAGSALKSEFFTTKPLACDPSSLPKYPPSKEFDAKLRDEEARRQRAAALKGYGSESGKRGSRDSKTMPAPDVNTQKQQAQSNPKVSSEKFNQHEDCVSGFPADLARGATQNGFSHSGQLLHSGAHGSQTKKLEDEYQSLPGRSNIRGGANGSKSMTQRSYMPHAGDADLSNFVGLAATRSTAKSDNHRERIKHAPWLEQSSRHHQLDVVQSSEKPEWAYHLLDRPSSSQTEEEKVLIKESATGYGTKQNRIHYSGPLMPAHGNIEEMLKEHERQIQQAVRKARLDKAKTRKTHGEKGQYEALLLQDRNGIGNV